MIRGFRNSDIYLYRRGIVHTDLLLDEEGRIKAIGEEARSEDAVEVPSGQIVVPGFIDEHIHGSENADAMDAKRESLEKIAASLPQDGVTSFCFTTMTMKKEKILSALKEINNYFSNPLEGSEALGIHVEGPFINGAHCGAQNPADILDLDEDFLKEMIQASGDHIKEITLAYQDGHDTFFQILREHGITISIGHSDNSYEETERAFFSGVTCGTHMFNAMRKFQHRDVGVIGALLLNEDAYCELICDLHHVSKEAIEVLYRLKGKEKIVLITDSMEAKHMKNGTYALGGQDVFVHDGVATLRDGTLAGSVLCLNEAVRNIRDVLSLSLTDAIDMASVNPAKNLHVFQKKGSIEIGKDGDFAIIDSDVNVYHTYVKGNKVYQR